MKFIRWIMNILAFKYLKLNKFISKSNIAQIIIKKIAISLKLSKVLM
jgi:hypothetical protein